MISKISNIYLDNLKILNSKIFILSLFCLNLLIFAYAFIYVCNFSSKKECTQQTKQQHIEFNSFGHRLTIHSCMKLYFHFFFRYLIRCYNNPSKTFNMDQQILCTFKCGTYLHVAIIHTHIYAQLYMLVCLYCKHFVKEVSLPRGAQILCFFHYNCQKIYYIVVSCMHHPSISKAHKRCF